MDDRCYFARMCVYVCICQDIMRIRLLEFLVIDWQVYAKCKLIHEGLPVARRWAPGYQVPIIVSSKVLSVTMSSSPNLCPSPSR